MPEFGAAPVSFYPTALGDLNHDGKADLVRAVNLSQVAVQLGLGDGTFGSPLLLDAGAFSSFVQIADLNNDTHPDLLVVNLNDSTVSVLLGNGNGTFQNQIVTAVGLHATSFAVTDFNKDGKADLIVTGYPSDPTTGYVSTLVGNGNGTFSSLTTFSASARTLFTQSRSIAVANLNGDTYPDFVLSDPRNGQCLVSFLNNQNGTFTRDKEMQGPGVMGQLTLADFNGDGKVDLAYVSAADPQFGNIGPGNNIGVALGNGDGSFGTLRPSGSLFFMEDVTVYGAGTSADTFIGPQANIVAADMDGDSKLDLVVTAESSTQLISYVAILRGVGNGTFVFGNRKSVTAGSLWVSVAELNGDATQDMVVTPNSSFTQAFVTGATVPAFTSPATTSFSTGRSNNFYVTASGNPAPTFSATGALPSGVTLNSAGLLQGMPAVGTEGAYPITITASNTAGQTATQQFTLTVTTGVTPPAVTSANSATFASVHYTGFTVTASGDPAPTLSVSGTLPQGVVFQAAIGLLAGTPAFGTEGTYPLTFTASNSFGQTATQQFTLIVTPGTTAPAITSGNTATFVTVHTGSFTVTATGDPAPEFFLTGALPSGVGFQASIGLLIGTPGVGTEGTYPLTITARNAYGQTATQQFTLIVTPGTTAPAITSVNTATFTTVHFSSFMVTATGNPEPTFSVSGALPSGVTFNNGGVLAGRPDINTEGTYPLTITARNAYGQTATQQFTLIVTPGTTPPAITSANGVTFPTVQYREFTVTATGDPTPTFSLSGALPAGVSFQAGPGLITGIPALNTEGTYPLTITASNSYGQTATQQFTLVVTASTTAPAITSASSVTFLSGRSSTFNVTATGNPTPDLTATGTLPTGVTFSPFTKQISGTPPTGTEGVYSITLAASNSYGQTATQQFTLTVSREDLVVTTAADEDNGSPNPALGTGSSLREVFNYAQTLVGAQTITFAPGLAGQTILFSITGDNSNGASALRVNKAITIQGLPGNSGLTISGGGSRRPFYVYLDASLTLTDLTISNGSAPNGAGIFNFGTLKMERCTLRNHAGGSGGALYNSGTAQLVNCTITGNAVTSTGGGIFNQGTLDLVNVTVSGNTSNVPNSTTVGGVANSGSATLTNTVVANNRNLAFSVAKDVGGNALNAASANNLIGTGGSGGLVTGVNGNIVGAANVGFATLANNGGPTATLALLPSNPAIDAGKTLATVPTDQRSVARPQGTAPDIGAYERPTDPLNLVVTTLADTVNPGDGQTSLREAIVSGANYPGPVVITFTPGLSGTLTVSDAWAGGTTPSIIEINNIDVTIQGPAFGPGITIAVAPGVQRRHFYVAPTGRLNLLHLTFTGSDITEFNEVGGVVLNKGRTDVNDTRFLGNIAGVGGVIENWGTLNVTNSTFSGNTGIYGGGAIDSRGPVTMVGSVFSGNNSGSAGGAISSSGSIAMTNCTFTGNVGYVGGALFVFDDPEDAIVGATMTATHVTIAGNSAGEGGGGGIYVESMPVTIVNSIIADNSGGDGTADVAGNFLAASHHNLIGTGGAGGLVNGVNGNLVGVPFTYVSLAPLASNGGLTQTRALLPGSVALNRGAVTALTTDQRGFARSVGTAPDIGAVEDATANEDPDGDTLTNFQELTLLTNPVSIDSDGDGFNDATEMMAATNPNSSASVPPATHIERVFGYGLARGLDLSGNFIYAVNVGTTGAAGPAGDANFTADNAPGVTVTAGSDIPNFNSPNFGSTAEDNVLATVYRSIRWSNSVDSDPARRPLKVDLANLVPGRHYKLQLLFGEAGATERTFDIFAEGQLIVDNFRPADAQGSQFVSKSVSAVVYEFTASDTVLNVVLDGSNVPSVPFLNADPYLNGFTLEEILFPAAAPLITPLSGAYESSVAVSMSAPSAGTGIRYTLDGSAPSTTNGAIYTGPFTLVGSATVRAIAVGSGWLDSPVSSTSLTVLTSLQAWRARQSLAANGTQDLANPSRDGVANLVKFAFNLAPNPGDLAIPRVFELPENGTAGLPFIDHNEDGRLVIEFVRRKAASNSGIGYRVETGSDLTNLLPLVETGALVEPIDATWERVTVTDPVITPKRFGRVRITIISPP